MKIFLQYLRDIIKPILLFIIFGAIFALIFYLDNTNISPIIYSMLLCVFFAVVFIGIDFYFYKKKHLELVEIKNKITLSIEELSSSGTLIERDYFDLIDILYREMSAITSKADNSKTDMIDYYTMWVHQIKTPIAAMRLLLQSSKTGENMELENELFKIEQYVHMVLTYLRLDSDDSDYIIKEYLIGDIIKQAVRKYSKLFIKKKITLNFEDKEVFVLTDEKWFLFVIEQVLSNSLKYTSLGTISIIINDDKSVEIIDTGIGISAEDLPRVFQKGYTGYNGRSDKKSTGIGLYLCQRILAKLSHKISIQSSTEKGTTVKISLDNIAVEIE